MKHFDDARKAVARIVRFTLLAIIGLVSLTFAVQPMAGMPVLFR